MHRAVKKNCNGQKAETNNERHHDSTQCKSPTKLERPSELRRAEKRKQQTTKKPDHTSQSLRVRFLALTAGAGCNKKCRKMRAASCPATLVTLFMSLVKKQNCSGWTLPPALVLKKSTGAIQNKTQPLTTKNGCNPGQQKNHIRKMAARGRTPPPALVFKKN